jgi:hypothetical protein
MARSRSRLASAEASIDNDLQFEIERALLRGGEIFWRRPRLQSRACANLLST